MRLSLMNESITHLMSLRNELKEKFNNPAFVIPYPTMNFGHIHGGDAANRICGCCELHMDIRPLPGMTLSDIDDMLNTTLEPVKQRWPGRLAIEEPACADPRLRLPDGS